jgi:Ca2+-binding RTX toxin-like protein
MRDWKPEARSTGPRRQRRRHASARAASLAAAVAIFAALLIPATASAASEEITSAGPLERIIVNDTLGCQVFFTGASPGGQYFDGTLGDTRCGTVLTVGGVVYSFGTAADSGPADEYGFSDPSELFTRVSQSAVTGSGTSADPYRIVTVVDAGTTGMRITETTTYLVGEERFRTDIKVENLGSAEQTPILYRFGDCYAGIVVDNRDTSSGVGTPGGGAACVQPAGDPNAPFALELYPLSQGSAFGAGIYDNSGTHIDNQEPLANEASPAPPDQQDSYHGLSWNIRVPVGNSVTCSLLTTATDDAGGPQHAETAVAGCLEPLPAAAAPALAATCRGLAATIVGTPGNDVRTGTPGRDVMVGLEGNDTLRGLAGNDVICGAKGNDSLNGGKGRDTLLGQKGNDKLKGRSGNDKLSGKKGKDTLKGGGGNDKLKGGGGRDVCVGGKANDSASKCEVEKSI